MADDRTPSSLTVVLAEDSPTQSLSLRLALEHHGFRVAEARDGREALELARSISPDVILSDALMPRMDGFQLCRRVRADEALGGTPFVIRTSVYEREEDEAFSLALGADAYVPKSLSADELVDLCRRLAARKSRPRAGGLDESSFDEMYSARVLQRLVDEVAEVESAYAALERTHEEALLALVSALDIRDTETEAHSWRVMAYSLHLADRLDAEIDRDALRRGALLHDIGKIGVPDRILRKPGPLDDLEWVDMRKHPRLGYEMLSHIEAFRGAVEVILSHHERWDGGGYPQGLAGDRIPLNARIFAVADTLDAVTSDRPYRAGRPFEVALAIVEECRGTQLDPAVVDAATATDAHGWRELRERVDREVARQPVAHAEGTVGEDPARSSVPR